MWSHLLMPCWCFCADMTINADKKKKLPELLAKRRVAAAGKGTSNAPPQLLLPPIRLNQPLLTSERGWWWRLARRARRLDLTLSSKGTGRMMPWRPHILRLAASLPPSWTILQAPLPLVTLSWLKTGGRVLPKIINRLPLLSSLLFSKKPLSTSKTKRWWKVWIATFFKPAWPKALETSLSRPTFRWVRCKKHKTCGLGWWSWRRS